jgi:RND family efflux transporter MFP subunit
MTPANTKIVYAAIAFVVLLVLIGWLAGFFSPKIDSTPLDRETIVLADGQLITIEPIEIEVTESVPGSITARDYTTISSRILSRIDSIKVRAGDTVQKGDVLIELEQADLKARVGQARDQANSISAQLQDARLRLERTTELFRNGDAAQAEVDTAKALFDSLSAQLASTQEALSEAEVVMSYSTIKAPIPGRIVERLAEPGDTTAPGTALLSLYDPLSLRAEANVREALALKLNPGQELTIELDALGTSVTGTIEEIVPAADAASRSFVTRASIAYNSSLMPGMFARFIIPVEKRAVIVVPSNLVTAVGELDFVRVYENGMLSRRFVRLGRMQGDDSVEVIAGVSPGERIVADPELL